MIDDSCEVPREDLDDGFNPCRKQVVENGELCQYAHMYDVMNERYDREEDTSYLNSVKRDKITSTTPVLLAGNNTQIYANSTNGEGRVNMLPSSAFNNPDNHTEASIPSSKAVADYVASQIPDLSGLEAEIDGKLDKYEDASGQDKLYAVGPTGTQYMTILSKSIPESGYEGNPATIGAIKDYAPIPLPISKGGTGGNTPYVTDDLDASAIFVMHDAPNDRYDAAPMSALIGYLNGKYPNLADIVTIPQNSDLNTYLTPGTYACSVSSIVPTVLNKPQDVKNSFRLTVSYIIGPSYYVTQKLEELISNNTWVRTASGTDFNEWTLLYPTSASTVPNPLPVDQGGTGAQTAQGALANLLPHTTSDASATGALVYDVGSDSTYLRAISGESSGNQNDLVDRAGIQAMIDAAVANLATKSDLENYVQKSTDTSARGQVYAVTKDGEQTMEDIVVHLV